MDPEIQWIHPAALMMSGFDTAGPSDRIYAVLYLMMSGFDTAGPSDHIYAVLYLIL